MGSKEDGQELVEYVDLRQYPILNRDSADRRALVEVCRAQLRLNGACVLENFLRPEAVELALKAIRPKLGRAHFSETMSNVYLEKNDPGFSSDHPRNRSVCTRMGCLAADQLAMQSPLGMVYHSSVFQDFLAATLDVEVLYPYIDPLSFLNVNILRPGDELGWHFDGADFASTLMLQPAQSGGVFEYIPKLRQPGDENYAAVQKVLEGDEGKVRELAMDAGALVLFRGKYALHRVTTVRDISARLLAVFSYTTEENAVVSEHNRELLYGRAF